MAFLRTFTALIAASLIWMALFIGFGEVRNSVLNSLAVWLSPMTIIGWLFYFALCFACFLLAQRFIGRSNDAVSGDKGH